MEAEGKIRSLLQKIILFLPFFWQVFWYRYTLKKLDVVIVLLARLFDKFLVSGNIGLGATFCSTHFKD